jgi:hypothetical protein
MLGTDLIRFHSADSPAVKILIGIATLSGHRGTGSEGILGLAIGEDTRVGNGGMIVNAMLDSDVIRNAAFSLFGWRWCLDGPNVDDEEHMDSRAGRMQGRLVLGSVLDSPPSGGLTWYPLAIPGRWEVKLNAVLLNAQEIFVQKQQVALIDSGTSFIATSQGNLEAVRQSLPDAQILQRDNQQDMWLFALGTSNDWPFDFEACYSHS